MTLSPTSIGGSGIGSAPGSMVKADWIKWGKAAGYLIASAAIVGALNGALEVIAAIDFASITFKLPAGIEVNGGQIGTILTNLVLYMIGLIVKDSRR